MDLTTDVPRSPYAMLGGINFLPRAIDKARADVAGTLGEYRSREGRTIWLLEFLEIGVNEFHDAVATRPTDEAMWEWIAAQMRPRTPEEIADYNEWMWSRTPDNDRWTWEAFRGFMEEIGQGHRQDIVRHFDRLDLDEGREVPEGGRSWK
ncbi:MAG: DUF5069 domain-containing protein [Chloroflexota bacterium]|nr:DUF5069 domain-containing protein [Chloroflexota bacterium]MDP6758644.1 DUF5069 domain-containing protein [Chloroflexota bacterium]